MNSFDTIEPSLTSTSIQIIAIRCKLVLGLIEFNRFLFCFSRKNSIVLRTQLSVRVHAIMGNISIYCCFLKLTSDLIQVSLRQLERLNVEFIAYRFPVLRLMIHVFN